jgi:ADP-ribosylglycohydrolase
LRFLSWIDGAFTGPYGSFGNGSAMRVSPVARAYDEPDREKVSGLFNQK